MAESNATQVILTDDGIKIIKAQDTADNAASLASKADSAALIAQSKANAAKSAADSSYKYANSEIAVQSTATAKAQSKADDAFSKAQAVGDQASKEIAVQSTATAKAQSKADDAFSKAQAVGSQASAEIAVQSTSTAKAQSKADDAFNQATTAIDTGKVTSQAVTDLKGGSKLTIAELENGLATKVANSDYASYKDQTASQIGQMVTNGAFSAYQQTTADLISSKVATKDFSAYQDTTAKAISSKVESKDFNTYKTQTDSAILSKVSSVDFNNLTISNRNLALGTATPFKMNGNNTENQLQNSYTFSKVIPRGTVVTVTFDVSSSTGVGAFTMQFFGRDPASSWQPIYNSNLVNGTKHVSATITTDSDHLSICPRLDHATGDVTFSNFIISESSKEVNWTPAPEDQATQSQITQLSGEIEQKVDSGTFSTYKTQTANLIAEKVANKDFSTYQKQTADLISEKVANKDFTAYQATTAKSIESKVESNDFNTYKSQTADTIASKVNNGDFSTYKTQTAKDINLRVTKGDLIDEINLQAGNTLISSSGQLTLSGKNIYFNTDNPVMIPSANIDTLLVGKQLKAANISANTFKTNNETFTVDSNGAITAKNMTLIGGTLTSPTFNTGDSISDSNNTSNFYPFTIEPTGKASTTLFNSVDALRTEMSGGGLRTMYRAINSSGSQYEAYDGNFSGDMISLNSGFTNGKDMSFSQSVSGSQLTGQVLISPLNGLTLHGDTQQITFNGTSADVTPKGIIITPYGNINPNGTQNIWYVGNGPTMKTASFGIDGSGANNIKFNRSLDIGNFNIGTYHTITSSDGGPIHFNGANGKSGDIFAATVHYESLVKVSLLSVKKNVRKVDTAYWAQLVNSIDLATYQYKTDDNTSHLRLSSIVDDVNVTKQWQLPDIFISRDENGKLNGVDDSVLLNATLATVQEQQKEIDQLNGHNMELEARLNKLEAKLNG
ncbi:phage tail protein [Lactiplantibacillus plantarum]|nr:phage tail protein [Lactiplantibacillus plantarum]